MADPYGVIAGRYPEYNEVISGGGDAANANLYASSSESAIHCYNEGQETGGAGQYKKSGSYRDQEQQASEEVYFAKREVACQIASPATAPSNWVPKKLKGGAWVGWIWETVDNNR